MAKFSGAANRSARPIEGGKDSVASRLDEPPAAIIHDLSHGSVEVVTQRRAGAWFAVHG